MAIQTALQSIKNRRIEIAGILALKKRGRAKLALDILNKTPGSKIKIDIKKLRKYSPEENLSKEIINQRNERI